MTATKREAADPGYINGLNRAFDAALKASDGSVDAMELVASEHSLTWIATIDGQCRLYQTSAGLFVNCWFDTVADLGFDDQIEIYEGG